MPRKFRSQIGGQNYVKPREVRFHWKMAFDAVRTAASCKKCRYGTFVYLPRFFEVTPSGSDEPLAYHGASKNNETNSFCCRRLRPHREAPRRDDLP